MKHLYLSRTKAPLFLTVLPPAALSVLSVVASKNSGLPLGYFPMAVLTAALAVFSFLYFFRVAAFGYEDIRTVGVYRSGDKVLLKAGKTLILTLRPHRRIGVEVIGNDGEEAALEWLRGDPATDIRQLRTNIVGGRRTVARILRFYHAPVTDDMFTETPRRFSTDEADVVCDTAFDCRRVAVTFRVTWNERGTVLDENGD